MSNVSSNVWTKKAQVDLVVCNTRVDVHEEVIKPSLIKGKDVYCEWPLSSTADNAAELSSLAKRTNANTIIGLQREKSPLVQRIKGLIEQENKIGKVLSSAISVYGGTRTRDSLIQGLKYFTLKSAGGNMITIGLGHTIDFVELVLGELSSFDSQLSIQRPQVPIIGDNGEVIETVTTEVADHIMLQGTLASGAPLSVLFRRGPPFKGLPGLQWSIYGEKGEIRLETGSSMLVDGTIKVHHFESDSVEDMTYEGHFDHLPPIARDVAAMYEAFADKEHGVYPNFEHAVLRHKQIEEVFKSSEENRKGVYI